MSQQFTGVLAAVVTPMNDDLSIDEKGVAAQVDHILSGGCAGVVPGGSTGEFTTLTTAERKRVNELYIEAARGRGAVVAGTGALSTAETIDLTRHAADAGADAVMVVPPFYGDMDWAGLLAHYGAISDAVDIPIMYYNIPAATGVDLTPEQFAELGRTTNVTCYKDTGGDATKLTQVFENHADDITVINGWDTLTFYGLSLGAKASVWGTASVIPGLCAQLYDALAVQGDLARGRELWTTIFPICEFLEAHNYPAGIKAGTELVGVGAGPARPPVQPLAPQYRAEFAGLLRAAGVDVVE
ncbi:dihydrodipicolinate synthase family protein [Gordonia sp. (in: high G+C Gram-positive bacteria)]|uniref:dihydrodipicolinate synthase family protein n=1 Tax=Gordonia sp. (in: high G+C Gram-positive bacteria) TaxID=84139 RepID=UPI00261858FF|nr:dihydrodipicolinate synthase family protein [Gordonia sp. (in: high G+C Gram-positive bacteria)]